MTLCAVLYGWSKAMLLLPGAKLAACWCLTSECLNILYLNVRQCLARVVYHIMVLPR